jgi:membrane bound O-acyltransferase family protein
VGNGPIFSDLLVAASLVTLGLVAAALCAGTPGRRLFGLLLGFMALVPPWFAEPRTIRAFFCLVGAMVLFRVMDLFRDHRPRSAARRIWHVVSPVDSRRLQHAPHRFDARSIGGAIAWGAVMAGGLWIAFSGARLPSPASWVVRWAGGLVAAYALVETIWGSVRGLYALAGLATPVLHDHPALSRSVRELWGERWARPVSALLQANILKPLARRGLPRVGLAAAFLGSAALHAYAILACAGPIMALSMLAYFLVQGLLVLLERPLGVSRWSPPAAHAWVIGVMILPSPLFTEPFLRAVG